MRLCVKLNALGLKILEPKRAHRPTARNRHVLLRPHCRDLKERPLSEFAIFDCNSIILVIQCLLQRGSSAVCTCDDDTFIYRSALRKCGPGPGANLRSPTFTLWLYLIRSASRNGSITPFSTRVLSNPSSFSALIVTVTLPAISARLAIAFQAV